MNEIQLLHEALNLIYVYNHGGEQTQEAIKKNGYNKRPISYFFPILIRYSPAFSNYYQKTFNAPAVSVQSQIKTYIKKILKQKTSEEDLDPIDIFLYQCYQDQTNYNKLWQLTQSQGMFTPNELSQLEQYRQSPSGPGAVIILASLLRPKQGEILSEPTTDMVLVKIVSHKAITLEEKQKTAAILVKKVKLYADLLKDPKNYPALIKNGKLTQAELNTIIRANLVQITRNPINQKEKDKTFLDVAEKLLISELKKREALKKKSLKSPPPAPLSTPMILPTIPIGSLFSSLRIPIHNFSNKIITSGFPILSNLIRGTGGQAFNGVSSLLNTGVNIFSNLNQLKISTVPVRTTIISIFIALFIVITIMSLTEIGGEAATIPPDYYDSGGGCPETSTNTDGFSCHYLNPSINIFETNISQSALDNYINKYSPIFISAGKGDLNEFKRRVNYIIEKSKQGGLNPVLFLGYWKTESLFSTIGTRDLGCVGNDFYEQVQCALAIDKYSDPLKNPIGNCARGNSQACDALKNIRTNFDKTHPISYPIKTFDDFAEAYGPYDHLTGGQPTNCISTYNKLIEVSKELGACKANTIVASCPVKGPIITCGTAKNPRNGCGHGGISYLLVCDPQKYECTGDGNYSSLLKSAIDLISADGKVYFPTVNGEKLTWKKKQTLALYDDWGMKVFYTATTADGHEITLNFTHLNKSPVPKEEGLSGEDIGATLAPGAPGGPHLHLAMMIDGKVVDAIEANLCQ